ncbi:solute carrier family 12 member 8 [Bufo gargarizans]|uniref:solute carrier family 12 member 8 n=1 Tax=Bufo gargarizans TaxID=30331 RepID=UPI001CF2644C|nr:solute carrier family 12 member 8 [Bufo gargarizans]XP_044153496.1 solute carrier family 12 member 8 [Bufo gargarizans]
MNGNIGGAPPDRDATVGGNVTDLFHEDAQVSQLQSQPWWKIQLFVWEPVLFGTWDGVFTSCMINIFGVVLFLRTGWLVGNTGVLLGVLLVSIVILVALVTVLSGIGVCERCSIGTGGVYSMISTVLGGKVGGTVGLLYIFGQCVAGAMYITGFAESISDLLHLQSTWAVRGISLAVLLALLGINLAGVKWIIRLQLLLLFLLAVSTLDFVIGSFTHLDPDHGFVGYSEDLLFNNTFPDYTPGENFFTVFGVFFPTATGVMAGFNMSGDLRRPSVSIPVGSLAAIAISWFLYVVFVFLLGAICTREFLRYDFMIAEKVSLVGFLFLLGLYISSLASCMGGLYGAPRILQCIAQEKVIPVLSFLGRGRGPNKTPVAAIFLTGLLTMAFVFIGQVNTLAPIVTINFMLTYSAVDYSYFSVTMGYNLQRSRGKLGRVTSRTPGHLQPLILDKSTSYGSNGTLLEFTKDMDQIFKPGHTDPADGAKVQEKEQKTFMKLKKSRKPAKETLQDSFQLGLQQDRELESRMSTDMEVTPTEQESALHQDQEPAEQSDEDVDRTGDQEQLVDDLHEPGADMKEESNTKPKVPEFEIQSLSSSFYSKLCNHWVSFIGAIVSIVIMFVIQWIYALVNIGVAVLLYVYIGRVSPGLNPGAAANFSFFTWIRHLAATSFRKKPTQEQFVVTPTFSHVGMETTQLTEENADFASRGRFHHSSVISQGHFINQFN